MEYIIYPLFGLCLYVTGVSCYSVCYRQGLYGFDTAITCYYGCCGSYYSRYCCPRTYHTVSSGTVAGIVIAVLSFIAVLIVVSLCFKKKYHGRIISTGRVAMQPVQTVQLTQTTVSLGPGCHPQQVMYNQGVYPQPMGVPMQATTNPGYVPPPPYYTAPGTQYTAPNPPQYAPHPSGYSTAPPPNGFNAPSPLYNQGLQKQ